MKLETLGLQRRQAAPTCFFDESSRARALAQSDDFVVAGVKDGTVSVNRGKSKTKERYDVKVWASLGRGADDNHDVVLGRAVRWRREEKHGRLIREVLGIVPGSNGVVCPQRSGRRLATVGRTRS